MKKMFGIIVMVQFLCVCLIQQVSVFAEPGTQTLEQKLEWAIEQGYLSWNTTAKSFSIGLGVGAYLPVGNTELSFDISPGIYGTALFGVTEGVSLEGCLSYWMLQDADNVDTFKAVTAGFRWDMGHPTVHVDTGVGAYNYTDFGSDDDDVGVSDYNVGVYGGIGVERGTFDVKIRVHAPDFDGVYLGASVTYLFDIGTLFR